MTSSIPVIAILLAGGTGSRMRREGHWDAAATKQFARLLGRYVIDHSFAALAAHPAIDDIVIVGAPPVDSLSATARQVPAGETRRLSVRSALAALPHREGLVLVHDAARPGLRGDMIDRVIDAASGPGVGAVIPVIPVTDTIIDLDSSLFDREQLMRVQTPQLLDLNMLKRAHDQHWSVEPTDDAQMVRALGAKVVQVSGDPRLHKLTVPADWAIVAAMLSDSNSSTPASDRRIAMGTGYDVHALVSGDHVWLCGVRIDHDQALSGHSDADVGLHALADALFGALGDGDIGAHFPPTDERWRGAASDQFLSHAADLVRARGGRIHHVDVTLICEAPKIGPHRDVMRARISTILDVPVERVGVKATTSERLGFTGRREGIAAQAAAVIDLPWNEK